MKKIILFIALAFGATFNSTAQFNTIEYLDINKVKAGFLVHGDMFWNPLTGNPSYEFPKGSGKHSGFASALWIGGIDQSTNDLKVAAQTYRNGGSDYWPGPLDEFNGATSDTLTSANWAQIWKVNKSTIDSFRQLNTHTITNTPPTILRWPGRNAQYAKTPNNNTLQVPDRTMAPFIDVNNDNIYNPLDGDYPDIKGEQMLWWIFNDNTTPHTLSQTDALKIEIHASAYACDFGDLKNTVFLNYKVHNWSTSILDSVVVSFWNDIDLGYSFDDYVGFDSSRRMGVTYNGDPFDETNGGYGYSLTQKAAVILKQPGDTQNWQAPVGAFTIHNNGTGADGDPTIGTEFYNYMTGSWKDGALFRKGCNLRDTTKAPSKYVYPDDPSVLNGISEVGCNNSPFDRRFLLSSAPFRLIPGADPAEYTFAYINTDTGVNNSNFNEISRLTDTAYNYINGCGPGQWPLKLRNLHTSSIKVYPNPSNSFFIIEDDETKRKQITLLNTHGQTIYSASSTGLKTSINTTPYAEGVYFLMIDKEGKRYSQTILIE